MKYHPPFGSTDPDSGYVDKNVPGAIRGSPVPAAAIELPQRELVDFIKKSGLTPSDDGFQLAQAVQAGMVNYVEAAGAANALTGSLSPALTAHTDGLMVKLVPTVGPNTASMTLNLGPGAVAITYLDGTNIVAGESVVGRPMLLMFYSGAWRLLNPVLYFTRMTPAAQKSAAAYTNGTVVADLPNPSGTYTVQTLTITGASYIDATGQFLIRNQSTSALVNVTGVLRCYDVTAAAYLTDGYSAGAILWWNGGAVTIPCSGRWKGLDPTHSYRLDLVAAKQQTIGPTDPSSALINAYYG